MVVIPTIFMRLLEVGIQLLWKAASKMASNDPHLLAFTPLNESWSFWIALHP